MWAPPTDSLILFLAGPGVDLEARGSSSLEEVRGSSSRARFLGVGFGLRAGLGFFVIVGWVDGVDTVDGSSG